MRRESPLFPLLCGRSFDGQVCAAGICGFTVVLTSSLLSATISSLHHPPEKE
jgi:hypothetical protein